MDMGCMGLSFIRSGVSVGIFKLLFKGGIASQTLNYVISFWSLPILDVTITLNNSCSDHMALKQKYRKKNT